MLYFITKILREIMKIKFHNGALKYIKGKLRVVCDSSISLLST